MCQPSALFPKAVCKISVHFPFKTKSIAQEPVTSLPFFIPFLKNRFWGFSRERIHVCSDRRPSYSSAQYLVFSHHCQRENKPKLSQERLHLKILFQGFILSSCDQGVPLWQQVELWSFDLQGLWSRFRQNQFSSFMGNTQGRCEEEMDVRLWGQPFLGVWRWIFRRGSLLAHRIQGLSGRKAT